MDRDDLIDLFSEFGPVVLRRMFSGYGIVADGVNFAMALRAGIIFRVDDLTVARYEAEGAGPFQYNTRNKTIVVKSYRHLPDRLYDDPEELAVWAREAVGAARRAAAKKSGVKKRATKPKPGGQKVAVKKAKAAPEKRKTRDDSARKTGKKTSKKTGKKKAGRKTGGRKRQAT
jgi:DNA transformation protein